MSPPGFEERLAQVEADVAVVWVNVSAIRSDVQWITEAITFMHASAPLPPRAHVAPPPPPPPW
ncbi:hypothetical protein HanIR_Chr09g0419361 [Helianthus annuus]|nr:hypothetical protein HanIR_Chr09g0419361 [Helianthus annuus]